ncbi:MAG: nucleotidyltransferase domain-containing protein [Deltaproteobacteria bacterium]|nr:nucleotidyltransferase domain-containing protein [Deltaproteobacteria bacterium]
MATSPQSAFSRGCNLTEKLKEILSELRRRFETLYGERLVQMVLYGSRARGDASPMSDIDVLVVLTGPVSPCQEIDRTVYAVAEISLKYCEVISCVFVSAEQFERERSPLLLNVRQEGMAI